MAQRKIRLEVVWTHTAEAQFQFILEYWLERNLSPVFPLKLAEAIWDRIEFLRKYPESAKLTDFPQTRNAVLGHFSILYKVSDNSLIIMAIWDNRDNPDKLLSLMNTK